MTDTQRQSFLWAVGGWFASTLAVWTTLGESTLTAPFFSPTLWAAVIRMTGGSPPTADAPEFADPSLPVLGAIVAALMAGAIGLLVWRGRVADEATKLVGQLAVLPGVWLVVMYGCLLFNFGAGYTVCVGVVDLVFALTIACWASALLSTPRNGSSSKPREDVSPRTAWIVLGVIAIAYMAPFLWMNFAKYWNLRTPHGDTAMYEEHLWNVLHGKGFRSYLDQGLFWGEHIQFVHLLLIPIYVLYPSHLTMEFCETVALASSVVPTYLLAFHFSGNRRLSLWLAAAVLLYSPLHYLDIEIDLKSFRPIAFGVPAMLWAFYFVEKKRWRAFTVAALLALSAKEDYSLILGPLGLWVAWSNWQGARNGQSGNGDQERRWTDKPWFGLAITAASAVYLLLAVKVLIPWFRGGDPVHYARYFSKFGETPGEVLIGMLTRPGLLVSALVTRLTVLYVVRTFAQLAFAPLLSPSRLLVGIPLLALLVLNELSLDPAFPVHHFHAPLVPVLLWATAAGVGQRFGRAGLAEPMTSSRLEKLLPPAASLAKLTALAAFTTSVALSFWPMSIAFWDSGRSAYWKKLYVADERVRQFEKVIEVIPLDSKVASTDYVHPRFTHHERSYDYSGYVRKVAGYEDRVPDDTDYIVLDVQGPHSEIHTVDDVRELKAGDGQWEVVPVDTNGYFIVLKRVGG